MASPAMCCVDVSQENELDHSSSLVTSDMSGLLDTDEKPDELNASFDFSEDSCRFEPECILSCPNMACSISEEQTPQPGDVDVVRSLCTATSTSPVASVSSRYGVRLTGDLGATSRVNVCTDTSLRPSSTVVFTSPSTSVLVDDSVSQDETSSQAVSHSASQTHPVVIGNDGAASFVRNVLKDLKPTSSLDSLPGNVKDGITVPAGYVLLSKPTIVPGLVSMVQSGPGTVAAPVIIQLASDVVSTPPASTLQAPSVVGGTMTNTLTVPAHSPTLPFFHRIQSGSIRGGTGTVFDTGSREHARQAVVIGCVNPSVRTGKGMQQILNHFLQQNNQPGQSQSLTSSLEPHSGDQQTYIDVSEITPTTVGSVSQTETCLNTHGESQQTESKRKNVLGSKQQITQTRGKNMPRSSKRVAHASGLTATGTSHLHSSSKDLLRDSMIFPDWSEFPVQGNNPLVLIVKEVHCHQNNMQCDATETLATYTTSSQSTKSAGKHVSASGHMDVDQHAGNDMSEEPAEDEVDGTSTVCSSLSLLKDDCHVQHCANSAQHVSCANSAPHASCANSAPHASGANSAPHASGANSAPHVSSPYSAPHVSCAIGSVPLSVLSSSQSASKDAHDAVTESGVWMANTETDSFFSISQGTDALTRPGDGAEGIRTETSKEALSKGVIRPIIICIVQEDGSTRQVNIYPAESEAEDGRCKPSSDFHITADTESTPADTGLKSEERSGVPHGDGKPVAASVSHVLSVPSLSGSPATSVPSSYGSQMTSVPSTCGSQSTSVPSSCGSASRSKRYSCDLCTATFSRLGNYTRHRKIHTVNLKDDKCHKCPNCDRSFLQRCDMRRHLLIHTKQEPFQCQTCGKGYIRKSDLVVHERFHSKDRAFKCEECDRRFYQSGDLRRHKRAVHGEQSQLTCGHCQRKYAREVTLIRHMKTAHNDLLQCLSQAAVNTDG